MKNKIQYLLVAFLSGLIGISFEASEPTKNNSLCELARQRFLIGHSKYARIVPILGDTFDIHRAGFSYTSPEELRAQGYRGYIDADNGPVDFFVTKERYQYFASNKQLCQVTKEEERVSLEDYHTSLVAIQKYNQQPLHNPQLLVQQFGSVIPSDNSVGCAMHAGNMLVTADHTGYVSVYTIAAKNKVPQKPSLKRARSL